jgi:hypothetical protein
MATVDDLVEQVRQQTDESNTAYIEDADIIKALDRAQRNAMNIISRKFPDMFYESEDITTVAGQYDYDIPRAASGRGIAHVEVYSGDVAYPMTRIDVRKSSYYRSEATTARPMYYGIKKNSLQLFPAPSGGVTVKVYFQKRAEPLVKSQGQITAIGVDDTVVTVDTLGSDLSVSIAGFASYVNFIDRVTGAVRGTCQINSIDTDLNEVFFKTSGLTRSTVLDKTVATSMPSDLEIDDYVCLVTGTCVPELDDTYTDFLLQYAVVDIKRRFGDPLEEELEALKRVQEEIEKMWANRNQAGRVRKSNSVWGTYNGSPLRNFT